MIKFTKWLFAIGIILLVGVIYMVSATGLGLKGIHNAKIMKQANKGCPEVDEFGNCLTRSYRSAYYRDYYFDNSSYGRGK